MPSTPKSGSFRSLRLSDGGEEDEAASQAITSGGEEDDVESDEEEAVSGSSMMAMPPQLVMPSLAMPSRRPFTERGKRMGRLKVAVAGASGTSSQTITCY